MGKAGSIIFVLVVVVAILLLFWGIGALAKWLENSPKEPKSVRKKAVLADEAYELFRDILYPKNLDGDISYLSEIHKAKVKSWAEKFGKVNS